MSLKTLKLPAILKDLLSGALPWTELIRLLRWHFFLAHLDDEIRLIQEN
jgi:hypothetical protein